MSGLSGHEIHTERLSMRPLSEGDAPLYCALYGDPDTMRFVGPPLSRQRALAGFRKALAASRRQPVERLLVIVEKATRRPIGLGAYQDFDASRRRVQAGMMLGGAARGRGFGKEGLRALLTHAFTKFPVDEVWIQHAADHENARRVPLSLGLLHNTDAANDDGSGRFVWSAFRGSWCQSVIRSATTEDEQCPM